MPPSIRRTASVAERGRPPSGQPVDNELFEYAEIDNIVVPEPDFGGFLRRVNRHLMATGRPFMSLVDARRMPAPINGLQAIAGTDIDVRDPAGELQLVTVEDAHYDEHDTIRQIGVAARLLMGQYPGVTAADAALRIPQQR